MKTRIVLFLILFCLNCFAQQKKLDSLLAILKSHPSEDTTRLNLLNSISYIYSDIDYTKGLETSGEAIVLAQKLGNKPKLAEAFINKGFNYDANGEDSAALEMFRQAGKLYEQSGDRNGLANSYHCIGLFYNSRSEYYTSLEYHQKELQLFEKTGNKKGIGKAANSMGVNYLYLANYPKALDCYLRSLQISEQTGDKEVTAASLTNIGIVYNRLDKYSKALEYHQKSLAMYEQLGNKQGMANAYGNIGIVYDNSLKPGLALEYYKKGLALNETLGNKQRIAGALTNIAISYIALSMYPEAMDNLKRSVEIYEQTGNKTGIAVSLNYIGEIYFKAPDSVLRSWGISSSNRYNKAIEYNRRSLKVAVEIGDLAQQQDIWSSLANAYEAQKDFRQSLDAYKQFTLLKDSISNDEKKEDITRLSMQYEFDKKEAIAKEEADNKQALAAAEIKRQRLVKNTTIAGAGILGLASIFSFIFYKRKRDAVEQQKEAELKAEVTDTEMKALRSQMNPHFIFNSLNSIADYIDKQDARTASYYTVKFAKLMRMILENSEKKEVSVADDLKALELYMQLEAMRMNNKFTYEIDVDENINTEETVIPPLLLQPFVENSIWHGIAKKQGEGKILIRIKKGGEMINCIVEDNGIGRIRSEAESTAIQKEEKKSLGMKITKARIDILNRIKKTNAGVELIDLDEGMRVELKLPLELSF